VARPTSPNWPRHPGSLEGAVTITPQGGQTQLRIRPGGITIDRLVNTFTVARDIRKALASSPSLSSH
jgi:hypothetical protein